jgi:hypothetical protein
MLYPEEFWAAYGRGAMICDARGRKLQFVMACNLETGEVVMYDDRPPVWNRLIRGARRFRRWDYWRWHICGGLPTKHGFWPAPLQVVPKEPQP